MPLKQGAGEVHAAAAGLQVDVDQGKVRHCCRGAFQASGNGANGTESLMPGLREGRLQQKGHEGILPSGRRLAGRAGWAKLAG